MISPGHIVLFPHLEQGRGFFKGSDVVQLVRVEKSKRERDKNEAFLQMLRWRDPHLRKFFRSPGSASSSVTLFSRFSFMGWENILANTDDLNDEKDKVKCPDPLFRSSPGCQDKLVARKGDTAARDEDVGMRETRLVEVSQVLSQRCLLGQDDLGRAAFFLDARDDLKDKTDGVDRWMDCTG